MSAVNADFVLFRDFLEKSSGILLGDNKQYLVSSRLNKLMETEGIKTLSELVQRIQTQPPGRFAGEGDRCDDDQRNPLVS
ncbi:chemotaxis methyl-accepting protein methylase [Pseudomonas psychrotolerans]|nr:chemotaxis methyl-accepting protein methylase [Pseudomonas psychrotolerans]